MADDGGCFSCLAMVLLLGALVVIGASGYGIPIAIILLIVAGAFFRKK